MTDLSPAAQLVWDAFCEAPICAEVKLAAALRAAAEVNVGTDYQNGKRVATIFRSDILSIADEFEAQQ